MGDLGNWRTPVPKVNWLSESWDVFISSLWLGRVQPRSHDSDSVRLTYLPRGALGLLPVFLAAQCRNASTVLTTGGSGLSGQLPRADPRRHVNVHMLSQGSALVSGRSHHKSQIKNAHSGAVEMAQKVKASIARLGDPGLIPGPARWEERTGTEYRLSPRPRHVH